MFSDVYVVLGISPFSPADVFRDILVDIARENAKKILWPEP
jgi:hypothetical protein